MLPEWRTGLITGALAAGAYWIAMWAMTQAPITSVTALRDTWILFAMTISVVLAWRGGDALARRGGTGDPVDGIIALKLD